jgi:hypothetical protein
MMVVSGLSVVDVGEVSSPVDSMSPVVGVVETPRSSGEVPPDNRIRAGTARTTTVAAPARANLSP